MHFLKELSCVFIWALIINVEMKSTLEISLISGTGEVLKVIFNKHNNLEPQLEECCTFLKKNSDSLRYCHRRILHIVAAHDNSIFKRFQILVNNNKYDAILSNPFNITEWALEADAICTMVLLDSEKNSD